MASEEERLKHSRRRKLKAIKQRVKSVGEGPKPIDPRKEIYKREKRVELKELDNEDEQIDSGGLLPDPTRDDFS